MGQADVLHDGQTQTGAAEISAPRLVNTIEALENPRLLGFGYAYAMVHDRHARASVFRVSRHLHLRSRIAVLDSVVDEIDECLL
jgi:hypothetical protein